MWPSITPDARRSLALRLLEAVLIGTSAVFAIAAVYMSLLIFEKQDALTRISQYDVAWSASQGANEFIRLQQRITSLAGSSDRPSGEEVQLRYAILKSRLSDFSTGEFQDFVHQSSERQTIVTRLADLVERLDGVVHRTDQPKVARSILSVMADLESDLIGLASEANQFSATKVAQFENDLLQLHRHFSLVALGFFLCGLAFIALLAGHNRLLTRAHAKVTAANADLQRTSEALASANDAVQLTNQELITRNHLFDTALNNMARGLCMFDSSQRLIVCNRSFASMYGLTTDRLVPGVTLHRVLQSMAEAGICSPEVADTVERQQRALIERTSAGSMLQKLADGRIISICHEPMQPGGWVATYDDETDRRNAERQIAHTARHDPLTGLPNRLHLGEHLEQVLSAGDDRTVVMMTLDLDGFKNVNDTLGHPIGDVLLCEVAVRIKSVVDGTGLVARLGGDEFVIIAHDITTDDATALAERTIEAIRAPFQIDGQHVVVGTSIGIIVAKAASTDATGLLKKADMALYRAKDQGRGTYCVFEPEMEERLKRKRMIELALRTANFDEEFQLFFQPMIDLQTKKVTTIEALLRWTGAHGETVGPEEFIPVAEDCGVIVPLGRWVLEKACALANRIPNEIRVAVNLSPTQFRHGNIVETVSEVLSEAGLPPNRLELEITETLLLDDSVSVLSALNQLRALGVRISLDDFGTGYSSLAYLRNFTVDKVKIDRSFIAEVANNRDHMAIVQAVVSLSHVLGITPVAEGVEHDEQLALIRDSGCSEAQGYLFSPPMPEQEIGNYLARRGSMLRAA